MAVIEIGVPTGFMAELESDLTKLVGVQKTETKDQKVMLYFDEVSVIIRTMSSCMQSAHVLIRPCKYTGWSFV